jgi:HYR domain-containing protein/galactose oxidase-like protein
MKRQRYSPHVVVTMLLISMFGLATAHTSNNHGGNSNQTRGGYSPRQLMSGNKLTQAATSLRQPDTLSLSVARQGHTATPLSDGRILFIGGENQSGPVSEAEILDPAGRTISIASTNITARANHTATLLPDGRVLVIGGSGKKGALTSTEIYDSATNSFAGGPKLTRPRAGHTATVLGDGNLLIAGGNEDQSAEVFDPSRQRFTLLDAKTNVPRMLHSATLLDNGKVLLVGGVGYYNGDTAELFDPKILSFSPSRNWLDVNRVRPSLETLPDGKVQIIGGDDRGTMEIYNPRGDTIRNLVDLTATADLLPLQQMMRAKTRTGLLEAVRSQKKNKEKMLTQLPVSSNDRVVGDESKGFADALIARADYTQTEVQQRGQVVIAGGMDTKGNFLQSVVLLDSSTASVTTDRVEYTQHEHHPVVSGAGWMPNEEVRIVRQKAETGERVVLESKADSNGSFTNERLSSEDNQMGVYILTIAGQSSSYVAQTAYRIAAPFNPQASGKHTKPFRVKGLIPVGAESGTIHTELGPLNWKATPKGDIRFTPESKAKGKSKRKGAIRPQLSDDVTFELYSFNLNWEDQSFPIPFTPLSIENSSGQFSGSFAVELKAVFDPGCFTCGDCCALGVCIPCPVLPSARAEVAIVGTFSLHTVNEIGFEGNFTKNDIVLFPFVALEADIPGTSFKVSATAGLIAGIELNADRLVRIRTTLDIENIKARSGTAIGFSFVPPDFDYGDFQRITPPDSIDGDVEMLDFGDLCARISVGPGVKGEFTFPDIGICAPKISAAARIAAFVEACVNPTIDTATCEVFNVDISVGAQLDFTGRIGCGVVTKSFSPDLEILNYPVKSFGPICFKDTADPVITVPSNIVRLTDSGQCTAAITYNATAVDDCSGVETFSCSPASGSTFQIGTTTVTCTATDKKANASSASFTVSVTENVPPQINGGSVSQSVLWPADHTMRAITVSYAAIDNCALSSTSLAVVSSEPDNGLGDGDMPNDIQIIDAHHVRVRSERSGRGNGRTYKITISATDTSGNVTTKDVLVTVPRNQ